MQRSRRMQNPAECRADGHRYARGDHRRLPRALRVARRAPGVGDRAVDRRQSRLSRPHSVGRADCRLHLLRMLARHLPPEWLHQEVPLSGWIFPAAPVKRQLRIDIGIVDPERLHAR